MRYPLSTLSRTTDDSRGNSCFLLIMKKGIWDQGLGLTLPRAGTDSKRACECQTGTDMIAVPSPRNLANRNSPVFPSSVSTRPSLDLPSSWTGSLAAAATARIRVVWSSFMQCKTSAVQLLAGLAVRPSATTPRPRGRLIAQRIRQNDPSLSFACPPARGTLWSHGAPPNGSRGC